MKADIRKIVVTVEETRREMGEAVSPPTRKAVAAAVIKNPFAGLYAENLEELMTIGEELGGLLGEKAVAALGVTPHDIESYGKAAIVGEKGEWEHAAALLHVAVEQEAEGAQLDRPQPKQREQVQDDRNGRQRQEDP